MKKIMILSIALLFMSAGLAYAEMQRTTLSYKVNTHTTIAANTELGVIWKWFGYDEAQAMTRMTDEQPHKGYRVAVRLEMFYKPSSSAHVVRYASDPSWAVKQMSYRGVYVYKSRHTIENTQGTTKYATKRYSDW